MREQSGFGEVLVQLGIVVGHLGRDVVVEDERDDRQLGEERREPHHQERREDGDWQVRVDRGRENHLHEPGFGSTQHIVTH